MKCCFYFSDPDDLRRIAKLKNDIAKLKALGTPTVYRVFFIAPELQIPANAAGMIMDALQEQIEKRRTVAQQRIAAWGKEFVFAGFVATEEGARGR